MIISSSIPFLLSLTFFNVARGAFLQRIFAYDLVTLETFDVKGGDHEDSFTIPEDIIEGAMAEEANRRNCNSLFVKGLIVNECCWSGPRYYTKKPDFIDPNGVKILYIRSLCFPEDDRYFDLYPGETKGVEDMKKNLVIRKIFLGRKEHILVGDVIVNDISYGPFLLLA